MLTRDLRAPSSLPAELVERILSELTNYYADDPTTQWTYCRHLSAHQKRSLETHFRDFWLPKLVVTIYNGARFSLDYTPVTKGYTVVSADDQFSSTLALFHANAEEAQQSQFSGLLDLWNKNSFRPCNVHLRLGENFMNDGLQGGYIVSDTGLPSLRVGTDGRDIHFEWAGAFDEMFREEAMRSRLRDRMVSRHTLEHNCV